jgi:hypothetical protein
MRLHPDRPLRMSAATGNVILMEVIDMNSGVPFLQHQKMKRKFHIFGRIALVFGSII